MKFFMAFVGTLCLMGVAHAQIGTVATTVTGAVNTAKANFAATVLSVNNTINAADQTILNAWNSYGTSMIALYNSYLTKYQAYTTVDLSQITNAIANIQSMMTYPPQRMQDDSWLLEQIFTEAQTSALNVEAAINAALAAMTAGCGTTCASTKAVNCANKFGTQLNSTTITIGRVAACVATEGPKFAGIGTDTATRYANAVTMGSKYLEMDTMCDIPAASVLNNPSPAMGTPQYNCFTNYLQRFSNTPSSVWNVDSVRWSQTNLMSYRAKRCSKLVALDIQERITQILAKYTACL